MKVCHHIDSVTCPNCSAPSQYYPGATQLPCNHCYCQNVMVAQREHEECCNCFHKRLVTNGWVDYSPPGTGTYFTNGFTTQN